MKSLAKTKRRVVGVVAAVVIMTMVLAFALTAPKIPPALSTCGGTYSSDGRCVGLPGPEEPGATCVPRGNGSCSWFWEPGYPKP